MPRPFRAALAAVLLALVLAPAARADRLVTLRGFDGPGPARYDKVRVLQSGTPGARNVLVLEPGTLGGSGYFRPLMHDLVARLPGWQVWAVERRQNLLEDHSVLDAAMAGRATPKRLFDYYLGWLTDSSVTSHFRPPDDASLGFAKRWGMRVAMRDLRRVITTARQGGRRRVVLGGHSLGATMTMAYASWNFGGTPGSKGLSGLVFIDGGSARTPNLSRQGARDALAALNGARSPFADLTGLGVSWATGVFAALGSSAVLLEPKAPSRANAFPLLPPIFKPPVPVTSRAQWGYVVDTKTGPPGLALVQMHTGRLARSGDPRDWVDGGPGALTTVRRGASAFAGIRGLRGVDGSEWFFPTRLSLDAATVNGGRANPAQGPLRVYASRGARAKVPMYGFETSLGKGRVLAAVRAFARRAGVGGRDLVLVDRSRRFAHIDPLVALPAKNDFLKTLVPFLRRTAR